MRERNENSYGCIIDVFHTGDETVWCFAVYNADGRLIGQSNNGHETADSALHDARNFARWYVR